MLDLTKRPHSQIPPENLQGLYDLAMGTPPGHFAELGVYKGGSAWAIYHALKPGFELHLFDTFAGLPYKDDCDPIKAGHFSDTSVELVKSILPTAVIHKGLFPDTFEPVKDLKFSFVHIDCDVYKACHAAINLFWPIMNVGAVMAFDDYPFEGIKKAIHDFKGAKLQFTSTQVPYFIKKGEDL